MNKRFNLFILCVILIEALTFLTGIYVLCYTSIVQINYRYKEGFKTTKQYFTTFTYTYKVLDNGDIDIHIEDIKLIDKPISSVQNYLIISKKYRRKDPEELKKILNKKGISNCFIFNDSKNAKIAKKLLEYLKIFYADDWIFILSLCLFLFLFFMKINLLIMTKDNLKTMSRLTFQNDLFKNTNFIYNYFFLNMSIIVIYPLFFRAYSDYDFDHCFGFNSYYFNSYFNDRWINSKTEPNLDIDNIETYKDNYFLTHKKKYFYETLIPKYEYIILFLGIFIWITSFYKIFGETTESSTFTWMKNKIINNILFYSLVIGWFVFFFFGFMNFYDELVLYHIYAFSSWRFFFHPIIFGFIFNFYFQIFCYAYMIYFSFKVYRVRRRKLKIAAREINRNDESEINSLLDESVVRILREETI